MSVGRFGSSQWGAGRVALVLALWGCLALPGRFCPSDSLAWGAHAEADSDEGGAPEGPMTAKKNDVDLALWSLITFVVFVVVLRKLAWGPMIDGLDKRESGVLQNIADAETARVKAEKMLAAHAEKLDKVQDEIRELLAEARRDAEHTKTEIIQAAQKEAEASRQRAVQEIHRARDQALDDLFAHMSRCVEDATEQVVGRSLTGPDHERLITEALTHFASKRH
ncbi:MAG: F0F1 ATP synthase subunit B [Planctomycetales bacterium]